LIHSLDPIGADALSPAYRTLLAHDDHMTTTLERFHGKKVDLRPLSITSHGDVYHREILLTADDGRYVVEYGVMRFDLSKAPELVRKEVQEAHRPLGEILIRHGVMRRIEVIGYLRLAATCVILDHFAALRPTTAYGRIGRIHCNGAAAIELLEIVTDRKAGTIPEY